MLGVSSIKELLLSRKRSHLKQFDFAFQRRYGGIERLPFDGRLTDLQLVAVCRPDDGLFRFVSMGYGIQDQIYMSHTPPTS